MKFSVITAFVVALLGLGTAAGVGAFHKASGFLYLGTGDKTQCANQHCDFILTFIDEYDTARARYYTLWSSLNMDTILSQASFRDTSGRPGPFTPGATIEGTINPFGEIKGYVAGLHDSPPLRFLAGGQIVGETARLVSCNLVGTVIRQVPRMKCTLPPANAVPNLLGRYADSPIRVYRIVGGTRVPATGPNDPACSYPDTSGTKVQCLSSPATQGDYWIEFTRRVNPREFTWRGKRIVALDPPPTRRWVAVVPPIGNMITGATVTFSAQPNLRIRSLTVSPSNPVTGSTITVTAVVENTGSAGTGPSTTGGTVDWTTDGTVDVTLPNENTGALPPSATESEQWPVGPLPAGVHRIRVCADQGGTVPEGDETDNCSAVTVVVASAPVVSMTLSHPVSVNVGTSVTATGVARDDDADMATRSWVCTFAPPSGTPAACGPSFPSGAVPNAANFTENQSFTPTAPGTLCFQLNVTDQRSLTGSSQACTQVTQITTPPPPPPPPPPPAPILPFGGYQEQSP